MRKPLVLASTSPYRRRLLDRLGVPVLAVAPPYTEVPTPGLTPAEQVMRFAAAKAHSVQDSFPDALIIGSDQGVALGDTLLGKPHTRDAAVAQLMALAGGQHLLLTAVCVFDAALGRSVSELVTHRLHFRALTPAQAAFYVDQDLPLDCAGSFKVESLGVALFESIAGEDPTGIEGLPLMTVVRLLATLGFDVLASGTEKVAPSPANA